MANEATIAKLQRHPDALDADGASDAIWFLKASPEMPPADVRVADYGDVLGVKLKWLRWKEDGSIAIDCEVCFPGNGTFDWRLNLGLIEKDGEGVPVERGAPEQMPEVLRDVFT